MPSGVSLPNTGDAKTIAVTHRIEQFARVPCSSVSRFGLQLQCCLLNTGSDTTAKYNLYLYLKVSKQPVLPQLVTYRLRLGKHGAFLLSMCMFAQASSWYLLSFAIQTHANLSLVNGKWPFLHRSKCLRTILTGTLYFIPLQECRHVCASLMQAVPPQRGPEVIIITLIYTLASQC